MKSLLKIILFIFIVNFLITNQENNSLGLKITNLIVWHKSNQNLKK